MKLARAWLAGLGCAVLLGCTSIPDVGTRAYVSGQMASVQPGNTPEQVKYILDGSPHYVTSMQQGSDAYEIWEYRIGNFLYAETDMVLFKNGRVLAIPRSTQELIQFLYSAGLIQQAQFWSNSRKNAAESQPPSREQISAE